ncbi:Zn-ribbon domain-containing OB-fold protein [Mycobacterium sp. C31M]
MTRPLPTVDPDSAPFWEAIARRELLLPYCPACDAAFFYPRPHCPTCFGDELSWRPYPGTGVVHSYTVVRRAPGPAFAPLVPYVVALLDLDGGARMMGNVVVDDPDDMRIGAAVVLDFTVVEREDGEVVLPLFRLAP